MFLRLMGLIYWYLTQFTPWDIIPHSYFIVYKDQGIHLLDSTSWHTITQVTKTDGYSNNNWNFSLSYNNIKEAVTFLPCF